MEVEKSKAFKHSASKKLSDKQAAGLRDAMDLMITDDTMEQLETEFEDPSFKKLLEDLIAELCPLPPHGWQEFEHILFVSQDPDFDLDKAMLPSKPAIKDAGAKSSAGDKLKLENKMDLEDCLMGFNGLPSKQTFSLL